MATIVLTDQQKNIAELLLFTGAFILSPAARPEIHKAIIRLFRHLSKTYFSHFEMSDESGYWETGEEAMLHKSFAHYNALLDLVASALQDFKTKTNDTVENLSERLERFLQERLEKR